MNKKIFLCYDSIEGIFTAIYDAWSSRYGHDNVRIQVQNPDDSNFNIELFTEYIYVKESEEKTEKVARAIREKISPEAYDMVCSAVFSDDLQKGDMIYRFLILGFSMGAKVVSCLSNDAVLNIFNLNRNVFNESHHFLGFLRFKEIKNHILLSKINPKNDILRLIAPHFSDRLNTEDFVIYDEKRKTAVVHRSGFSWIFVSGSEFDLDKFEERSEQEAEFQMLWKTFFDSIAIKERINDKLQKNNLPLRFRSNMLEFKD
ncbi:TIGR03915 family putative DNA repair protein [Anaerocolumna sp. MB42-C2]|uniref:TIGR03915 family putative DNA repair protein n=1 Tax=Anaerocolumna sp. MB42-C2 TaxID=3070997 RepID=UPI0027E0C3ED|nr:TIGR03915 family putative DNA repair protein [Anaerocolumna sp. MB42-C2]WMJ87618.1 TIGR03915 family putative DNA repair protein [Anaerocolumna sp. MB42-C2]